MTEEEADVVMAPHTYREVFRIWGGGFTSPGDWEWAINDAQRREEEHYGRLTELGFPDTRGMSPSEGHMARIAYLMTKYPKANWDMLLEGQEDAMARKPATPGMGPRPAPPVTVQHIEKQKLRFLGRLLQRDELMNNGDPEGMLSAVVSSWLRVKAFLERHGVDTGELAKTKNSAEYFGHPFVADADRSINVDNGQMQSRASQEIVNGQGEEPQPSPERPDDQKTMTAREASKLLGLTYQTVIRCLASGDLPYGKKVGRNWLITREPFMAWLDSNTDTVRSMTAQAGEKPGRKTRNPKPTDPVLPTSTGGRMPSF